MRINKAIRQVMKENGVSLLVMAKAGLASEKGQSVKILKS